MTGVRRKYSGDAIIELVGGRMVVEVASFKQFVV